jgi:hypothetical protein
MVLLPVDELNRFTSELSIHFEDGRIRSEQDRKDIENDLLEFFLFAYANGTAAANADLGTNFEPDVSAVQRVVYEPVAGETWKQRVDKYYRDGGTEYDIQRIAETDMTRIYNTAVLDVAEQEGRTSPVLKRWETMMDDRVRDTHEYLQSVVVPYDADFITYDGDRAKAPGLFSLPENNINCRCTITLLRG